MKGLILAAGKGTRLRPLTLTRPKPLLPIAGKPLLEHNLDNLVDAGITEIGIVVNPQCSQIPEAFCQYPASLTFIEQPTLSGTADALYQAREFIQDTPFVLVFGDNLTSASVSQLISIYENSEVCAVLGVFDGGDPSKHAVIQVEGDRVMDIEERPLEPKSTLTSAGMFVLEPSIFGAIEETPPSASGEYYLPDALKLLLNRYPMGYVVISGWRININTPRDMIAAYSLSLTNGHSSTTNGHSSTSRIVASKSAQVGAGVELKGVVWIGQGCQIEDGVHLKNVICLDGSRIGRGSRISWAILGENASLPEDTSLIGSENPKVIA